MIFATWTLTNEQTYHKLFVSLGDIRSSDNNDLLGTLPVGKNVVPENKNNSQFFYA